MRRLLLGAWLATFGACSDDAPVYGEWTACGFSVESTTHQADCLLIERPLGARTIGVHVQRLRAPGGASRGDLWLLQGGPGGSGASLRRLALALHERGVDLDIYLPDHRGTGDSTRLACANAYSLDCGPELRARWGDDLAAFSTSEAAHDLAAQIAATREGTRPVFVWGASYGTTWGHRYLQLHGEQPTAVILDSVCAGASCELAAFDRRLDAGARAILDACTADAACAARLPDPAARVGELLERVASGACAIAGGRNAVRTTLAQAAMIVPRLLPALVYRLHRCAPGDLAVLTPFRTELGRGGDPGFSLPLQLHIVFSELWPDEGPDAAAEEAFDAGALVTSTLARVWINMRLTWPRYPAPPVADQVATTTVPLLLLSGTWDMQTPLELSSELAGALAGPHQHHLVVPYGPHGLLLHDDCATAATLAFFADPTAPLDPSCAEHVPPPDFFDDALAQRWFGTADAWD